MNLNVILILTSSTLPASSAHSQHLINNDRTTQELRNSATVNKSELTRKGLLHFQDRTEILINVENISTFEKYFS